MFATKQLAIGLVLLGAVEAAEAQSVHLSYGRATEHGDLRISLSAPFGECRTAPRRVWVPGHYEELERRVWVEGSERREWVPPVYETRIDHCGRPVSVLVQEGHWRTVCDPGHFELRTVRVWVEGYWETELVTYGGGPSLDLSYRTGRDEHGRGHADDRGHGSERGHGRSHGGRSLERAGERDEERFDGFRYDARR